MRYHFFTADVFTDQPFSGNQLSVFPDARGLDGQVMQQIAREFNLSETVFVLPAQDPRHTRRLRIFTPGAEVPFAGHPTVGTAYVLAAIGDIPLQGDTTHIVLEEGVGPVPVTILALAGKPSFTALSAAKLPEFGPPPPQPEEIAAMLSLEPSDLLQGDYPPELVSCGLPFLFVPLQNRDALRRSHLDMNRWANLLASYWTREVFVFTFDSGEADISLRARMYAPAFGIAEDPATGAAATALAGYLESREAPRAGTLKWVVRQGVELGRPSTLYVEADKAGAEIRAIRVGGASVLMSEGWIETPQ